MTLASISPGRAGLALAVLWLYGCSTPPTAPVSAAAPAVVVEPAPAADPAVSRFEQQKQDAALLAQRQGRLAEAALAWEVLTVLRPDNSEYRARLGEVRQAIDRGTAQRMARALSARQRGDAAGAERAYLDVLSLDPRHAGAASALREIEVERNRASVVGKFVQPPNINGRSGNGSGTPPAARGQAMPAPAAALPVQRNLLEHASLLAGQGELDSAIAMLNEAAVAAPRDLELRKQLVHWLEVRGEQLTARDPKAARADFERALELDPQARNARARLQALPPP